MTSKRNWGAFVPIPIELVIRPIELRYDAVRDVVAVEKEEILETNMVFPMRDDVNDWVVTIELALIELVKKLFARIVLVLMVLALIELAKIVLTKIELVFSTRLFAIVVVRLLVFKRRELTLLVARLER